MPRYERQKIQVNKQRNIIVGVFHKLAEPGRRPPKRKLCTIEEAVYKVTYRGKQMERSDTEFTSFTDDLYYEKEAELLQARKQKQEESESVRKLMQSWLDIVARSNAPKTLKAYLDAVNHYIDAVGDHPIDEYRKYFNVQVLEYMEVRDLSVATRRKHITALQRFFNWAYEEELCTKYIKLKKPTRESLKKPRPYSCSQLHELEKFIRGKMEQTEGKARQMNYRNHYRALIMMWETAMRGSEVRALMLENILLHDRQLRLVDVPEIDFFIKGKREEFIPISDKLFSYLKNDLQNRGDCEKWYLDKGDGRLLYSASLDPLTQTFGNYQKQLGISGVKPLHGVRAYVITKLLAEGKSPRLVQAFARHRDFSTTEGYFDAKQIQLSQLVNQISEN